MTARFDFVPTDSLGRGRLTRRQWTLCLGAGVNGPLMPTWEQLACKLTNKFHDPPLTLDHFRTLYMGSGWSLEAWIQQALNQHIARSGSVRDFTEILRAELYEELARKQTSEFSDPVFTDALCSTTSLSKTDWLNAAAFAHRHFGKTTAYRLARLFVDNPKLPLPESVITLNADTLFETIFSLLKKEKHNEGAPNWTDPPQLFSRRVRPSQDIYGHIPIYHLHGCLPPQSTRHKHVNENSENMIFPENSYTGLAGQVFTWTQNAFLHAAQTTTLCFIGMSMSDPNVRRWMSWAYGTYIEDLRVAHSVKIEELGGRHVWITTRGKSPGAAKLYPFALRHLGVQICWLDSWDDITPAMISMLGSPS
jgi:hypothetical protein